MKLVKKVWAFIGTSGAWFIVFIGVMIGNAVLGHTLIGMIYLFISVFGFFLCRISEAIEKIVEFQTAETVVSFEPKRVSPEKDIEQDIEFIDAFKKFTNKDT